MTVGRKTQTGKKRCLEDERRVLARRPERQERKQAVRVHAAAGAAAGAGAVAGGDAVHEGRVTGASSLGARDAALDVAPEADAGREHLLAQRRDELLLRRAVHVAEDSGGRQLFQGLGGRLLQVRAALGERESENHG